MSDCCSTETINTRKTHKKASCPECQRSCKSVSNTTMLQHLCYPLNRELDTDQYFYCANSDCENSYFSESGTRYSHSDLRNTVGLKQTWLCYCFDISKQRYQQALSDGSAAQIKNFIIEKTKLNQCACETRNPSGLCCLVDFKKLDKQP